ncbi:SDR family NAD(P)-dependent oxidoreductase [Flagellimonas flava]|uniref:SDR family NAD(P)-dependent oxidoreductase n=1 Tax=Flagellimonas flava TaxID=570519 RepID=UPI003D6475E0
MDLQLKGKKAFISGSTAGIGFALAKSMLAEGAEVTLNGRSSKSLEKAMENLQKEIPHGKVNGIAADFENRDDIEQLLDQLPEVDILINNIGIYKAESFFQMKDEDWYRQFEVNVMSGVRLSRLLLPKMLERNWGRILFVSSECASLVPPDMLAYSTTKTAMLAISKGLAQLTKGTGVTINSVLPGSTLSEGAERFLETEAEKMGKTKAEVEADFFKDVRTSSLLQRFASVDEVAHTITYLSSPLAAATNGAAIKIDGGSTSGIF